MKTLAYPLAILASCVTFDALAGEREFKDMTKFVRENPTPALLAKIQLATQAYQTWDSATKEAKMVRVRKAPDSSQAPGTAIGAAIGGHANDGDED